MHPGVKAPATAALRGAQSAFHGKAIVLLDCVVRSEAEQELLGELKRVAGAVLEL